MNDLISRQAAIETVMECYDNDELFEVYEEKLRELPPANCSEFPNSSDTISRQQATDTLRGYLVGKRCPDDGTLTCRLIENEVINKLPPAQPTPDQNGDIWITVPDIDKVTCIYVQESKSKFCRIFYEER